MNDNSLEDSTKTGSEGLVLSKNAQKRLAKQEKFAATKKEWKAKLRERKKIKKLEDRSNGIVSSKPPKPKSIEQEPKKGTIIVDAAYETLMSSKELCSFVSQMCRCYSVNRRTPFPFNLAIAGIEQSKETIKELERSYPDYGRWSLEFMDERLEDIEKADPDKHRKLVYLSADSDTILEEIDNDAIYVIGGIVDRNRHKNVAAERAKALNVKTARLPIGEHIKLKCSQVLTIIHVFEVFCKYREFGNNWEAAIQSIMPERKRADSDSDKIEEQ